MKKILEAILNTFRPTFEALIFTWFCTILRKIKPADKLKTVLTTLYVPVDAELETLVKQTADKNDDVVVSAIKNAIETVAAENSIELLNVDND